MVAGRCNECDGVTVMKGGTAVMQHTDPDCPVASDFEPIANATTGMRDILVPTKWQELVNITEELASRSKGTKFFEVHLTVGFDAPALGGSSVLEIRGTLLTVEQAHRPVLRFKRGAEIWAYKRNLYTEKPDLDSGVPIGAAWGLQDVYITLDTSEIFEIQIIHQPSPHAPVTIASQVL